MPLVKQCVHEGCQSVPVFGYGSPSKGMMRWACRAHRDLIWFAVPHPTAKEGGPGLPSEAPRPPSPRQETLF